MKKSKDGPVAIDIETSNGVDTDEVIMIQRAGKPAVRLDDMARGDITELTGTEKTPKNFVFDVPEPFYSDTQILGRIIRTSPEPSMIRNAVSMAVVNAQTPETLKETKETLLDVRKDDDDYTI